MKCKYFKYRHKKGIGYCYCTYRKRKILYTKCSECVYKQFKPVKQMKKISTKLRKLQNCRDKDLIKIGKCENCGRYSDRLDPHEVYGGGNRQRSIKNGFVKRICRNCHNSEEEINKMRIKTQLEYEKDHTREEFISIIGKSYL